MFFCFAFKNTGICSVLCISGLKSIGIYSIFCVFAWLPQKTLKRKNAVIYSILWLRKAKNRPKNVSKRHFFPILGTLQTGGGAFCSWRRLWATRIPSKKLSPTLLKDFWCFSGPGVGGSAAWGAPHHRALVALGRSWRICQRTRVEPAEPNLRADAPRRLRRISRPSISSQCGLESFWMGTCFRNIVLMFFEKSSSNRNFVGNRRLFSGASEFPKAPAKGFSRRTAANFNLLLRVKAPLCKDFSV